MQKNLAQHWKILLKSSFLFLLVLTACAAPMEIAQEQVEKIDNRYGGSVQDYRLGLKYFDVYARETPMNQGDLVIVIQEIEALKAAETDAQANAYYDFRLKLFQAEKEYKLASRKPFASYDHVIRCKNAEEILVSVEQARNATMLFEEAVGIYESQGWTFFSGDWPSKMQFANTVINDRANAQEGIIQENCNASQTE